MGEGGTIVEGALTRLATCWRLVRGDGVALGFTSHDRPLMIGGLRHDSAPGMSPSAVVQGMGLDVDTMEVAGVVSADALTEADLLAGRWTGARVELFMVDWAAPDAGRLVLASGRLGAIEVGTVGDPTLVATLESPVATLRATLVERYAPMCRARLGDARCRIDMRPRRHWASVLWSADERLAAALPAGLTPGQFVEGEVRALDGPLAGLDRRIVGVVDGPDHEALLLDAALAAAPGTRLWLWEGCDRRFQTCVSRFGNARHFRGEPHVPGDDLLLQVGAG
jgi:uncharacterized phage protein (TIGR02218 family)